MRVIYILIAAPIIIIALVASTWSKRARNALNYIGI